MKFYIKNMSWLQRWRRKEQLTMRSTNHWQIVSFHFDCDCYDYCTGIYGVRSPSVFGCIVCARRSGVAHHIVWTNRSLFGECAQLLTCCLIRLNKLSATIGRFPAADVAICCCPATTPAAMVSSRGMAAAPRFHYLPNPIAPIWPDSESIRANPSASSRAARETLINTSCKHKINR